MRIKTIHISDLDKNYSKKYQYSISKYAIQNYDEKFSKIYEQILKKMIFFLNSIHKCKKNELYWRTIIGPWLISYVACFLDRKKNIKNFFNKKGLKKNERLIIYDFKIKKNFKFNSFIEFAERAKNYDDWNHQIYCKMMQFIFPEKIIIKKKLVLKDKKIKRKKISVFKIYLISFFFKFFLLNNKKIFFDFNLGRKKIFLLSFKLKSIFFENIIRKLFPNYFNSVELFLDNEKYRKAFKVRDLYSKKESKSFNDLIFNSAVEEIPKNYLENYETLKNFSQLYKIKNKSIFSLSSHIISDFYKVWLAENQHLNNKFYIFDHGGGLRARNDCQVKHESLIADKIFTWSNLKKIYPNSIQTSPFKIIKLHDITQFKRKKNISVISPGIGKYIIWASSMPTSSQSEDDVKLLNKFFKLIKDINIKNKIFIKLPFFLKQNKYYDMTVKFWKNNFLRHISDNKKFYPLNKKLDDLVKESKLIILMSPQTTLSEVLISNTPFILLYNSKHWPLNSRHEKIFKQLKNFLYFEDPKKAAKFMENNYNKINIWWNTKKIKKLRSLLKKNICNLDANWINQLERITSY